MTDKRSRPILITGCSTGIGRSTAELLGRSGWRVYATARNLESIKDLESLGCRTLALDVTDDESMRRAVAEVEQEHGAVWGLVNNAGYGLHGAIETTALDEARRQFETNFFGLARLTQLVLPRMRARRSGRIVNMSSMGGRFTLVGGGYYHASKHAVESLSDALRYECRPFGIDVVVIEPGLIKTRFGDTAVDTAESHEDDGPYASFNVGVAKKIDSAYTGLLARAAGSPESVAKVVAKALGATKPRTRYMTTAGARAAFVARRLLPDRAWDAVLRAQYPEPKP